jgi:hypothetical protein
MGSGFVHSPFDFAAIGVLGKEHINRTRMNQAPRTITDKTQKDLRQSALSASSAFYETVD